MQKTLKSPVEFHGIGLHSGQEISMRVEPASENYGIVFERTDIASGQNIIEAKYDLVNDTRLNTRICNAHGVFVSTIEHLMAAFAGVGITNAHVKVDASETPALDGSSLQYIDRFWQVGLKVQNAFPQAFRVVKSVEVHDHGGMARLEPYDGFKMSIDINFDDPAIGAQSFALDMANGAFVRELAFCRTFVRYFEVDALQSKGLALGGGLHNAVVIDHGKVLNPEGFRAPDECVRHKMLDALGDLYLAGGPIFGHYIGDKMGHSLTNQLLRKAFAEGALQPISLRDFPNLLDRLPGYALKSIDFAAA